MIWTQSHSTALLRKLAVKNRSTVGLSAAFCFPPSYAKLFVADETIIPEPQAKGYQLGKPEATNIAEVEPASGGLTEAPVPPEPEPKPAAEQKPFSGIFSSDTDLILQVRQVIYNQGALSILCTPMS